MTQSSFRLGYIYRTELRWLSRLESPFTKAHRKNLSLPFLTATLAPSALVMEMSRRITTSTRTALQSKSSSHYQDAPVRDAFYFIALLDRSDSHHTAAAGYLRNRDDVLVTTRWVLAEVANALGSPNTRQRTAMFIEQLQRHPRVGVLGGSDDLFEEGLKLYAKRTDKSWSLTDCISFIVMERENLKEALTGDRHFIQAGFTALFRVS